MENMKVLHKSFFYNITNSVGLQKRKRGGGAEGGISSVSHTRWYHTKLKQESEYEMIRDIEKRERRKEKGLFFLFSFLFFIDVVDDEMADK